MNCNTVMNMGYKSSCGHTLFLLGLGQMGCTVGICLTLRKMTVCFQDSCAIYFPLRHVENLSLCSNLHQNLASSVF